MGNGVLLSSAATDLHVVEQLKVLERLKEKRAAEFIKVTQEEFNRILCKIREVGKNSPFNRLTEAELAVVDNRVEEYRNHGNIIEIPKDKSAVLNLGINLLRVNNFSGQKILTPDEFRNNADYVAEILLDILMKQEGFDPENTIIVTPWRSALIMARAAHKKGFRHFLHDNVQRDELTLLNSSVYTEYPSIMSADDITMNKDLKAFVLDPMGATERTVVKLIDRIVGKGIKPENIRVAHMASAPEGQVNLIEKYDKVKTLSGSESDHDSSEGYIVDGLRPDIIIERYDDIRERDEKLIGDVGDQYFEGLGTEYADQLREEGMLSDKSYEQLKMRIERHMKKNNHS